MSALRLTQEQRPFYCSVKAFVKMLRLDIINSLVTATFMITISVLALTTDNTFTVLGGVLGLLAAVCCLADAALIYRKLLFNPSGPFQKSPDKI
ncbi:chemokine-like factor isoform X2 [Rhinolophus ferrumequinum]|uniref:Chemokine like factor n=1 Tax=Rhinolophus ferrumequinum TaxID=59479 RepID=A0A671ESF4_RHIFE|nr:chemokine-like factor isoform X2 [Rhinolophus ferrumequinum]